jgi:N-acetylglucosamine-6-sulfatase
VNGLVLSIDIAATALDIANIEIPESIQGKSLLPLIEGETEAIRLEAFIEYYSHENPFPWTAQLDYRVVVSERFKYIKWLRFDEAELYDLINDPNEQNNLIHQPAYVSMVEQMQSKMANLQLKALGLR